MTPWRLNFPQTLCLALCAAWLAGAAVAQAAETPSGVVARVFGNDIRLGDISPPERSRSQVEKRRSEADFKAWLHDYRKKRLEARIWGEVTGRVLKERGLEPTAAEVQELVSFMAAKRLGRLSEFRAQRDKLKRKLARSGLDPRERKRVEDHLATIEKLIAHEIEQRKLAETIPNYAEIQRRSAERVARVTVRQWNVNKALYEKYGGRVIFQQAGYEPVDAYRALIGEVRQRQAVEILDASFPAPFARMIKYLDMPHQYMPKEEADKYFKKPWWRGR
jgi:Trp operon repressor